MDTLKLQNVSSVSTYDSLPDILGLSNQGVNLFVNLSKKDGNGNYTLMTKLYDINSRALVLEKKNYTTSLEERFVF